MDKMNGESMDIERENINKIKEIFPEVFNEDKIDFEKLQLILGKGIEENEERYSFNWNGKRDAIRMSQIPTTGTLRPNVKNSKSGGGTSNIYIEGDNLEVLKILQKSYHGKIKMIYIDPPYNTGKDFVYKDNYRDNMKNYLEFTGQVDEVGRKISTNTETSGRYHTDWLNMMYPRLRLARNLLTENGVIFISIDDNEVHNLRKICDEIFGEDNFIGEFIRKGSGGRQDSKYYAVIHEYILCYTRNINNYVSGKEIKDDDKYPFYDVEKKSNYKTQLLRKWGENSRREDRPNLFYPIVDPDGNDFYPMLSEFEEGCWRWGKEKMFKEINSGNVIFKKRNEEWVAYEKIYEPQEGKYKTKLYTTIIDDIGNSSGAALLKKIFNGKIFDYPKPLELIKRTINLTDFNSNDIILDFFAGSSTTAQAVMELNAEDGGNRRYIMVQLPEQIDKKSEAYKAGYRTIADIGRERIRRSGEKILEDNNDKEGIEDLDIGFKAFKLDASNIKKWNPDYIQEDVSLDDLVNNFVPGRTEKDILFEIILKYGIDLSTPIEEHSINDKIIYNIGNGSLYVCLDDDIGKDIVTEILKLQKEYKMPNPAVVFKDLGFKNDEIKLNAKLTLNDNGIDEVVSI